MNHKGIFRKYRFAFGFPKSLSRHSVKSKSRFSEKSKNNITQLSNARKCFSRAIEDTFQLDKMFFKTSAFVCRSNRRHWTLQNGLALADVLFLKKGNFFQKFRFLSCSFTRHLLRLALKSFLE